jgi:hypothetical protein
VQEEADTDGLPPAPPEGFVSRIFRRARRKSAAPLPPDLSPYRRRAGELVERLKNAVALDEPAQARELDAVAVKLAELVTDLKAAGAPEADVRPLEELLRKLLALGPGRPRSVAQLLSECARVLEAFATPDAARREGFWK